MSIFCGYFDMASFLCSLILFPMSVAHTLSVIPQSIPELEGDPEVHFFCREDSNTFATNIIWQDPQESIYIPGSLNENGNKRILAEGSRLTIFNIIRNDTGTYRCLRNTNHTEFAEGTLTVIGMYATSIIPREKRIFLHYTCFLYKGVKTFPLKC